MSLKKADQGVPSMREVMEVLRPVAEDVIARESDERLREVMRAIDSAARLIIAKSWPDRRQGGDRFSPPNRQAYLNALKSLARKPHMALMQFGEIARDVCLELMALSIRTSLGESDLISYSEQAADCLLNRIESIISQQAA